MLEEYRFFVFDNCFKKCFNIIKKGIIFRKWYEMTRITLRSRCNLVRNSLPLSRWEETTGQDIVNFNNFGSVFFINRARKALELLSEK